MLKKKDRIIFLLLWFFFLLSPGFVLGFSLPDIESMTAKVKEEIKSQAKVYTDPEYTQPSNNFTPGQEVFIRLETTSSGEQEASLRLLNSQKIELSRYSFQRNGNSPYVFTAMLKAPEETGTYYLDIRIDSGLGAVFSGQQNINVGQAEGVVKAEAHAQVTSGSQIEDVESSLSTLLQETIPEPMEKLPVEIKRSDTPPLDRLIEIIRGFFASLKEIFTG